MGFQAQAVTALGTFATGAVVTAAAIRVIDSDRGSGPITISTQIGIDIVSQTRGTTNNTGIRIATPTGGTTNYGINFLSNTIAAAGITWGSDVNLYRSGANLLRTDTDFVYRHLISNTAIPVVTPGPGAGTGGSAIISGSDSGQQISLTTGTVPTANAIVFTVTYTTPYPNAVNYPTFSPTNAAAASLSGAQQVFIGTQTTANFTLRSGTTGLTATTLYSWNFRVRG